MVTVPESVEHQARAIVADLRAGRRSVRPGVVDRDVLDRVRQLLGGDAAPPAYQPDD